MCLGNRIAGASLSVCVCVCVWRGCSAWSEAGLFSSLRKGSLNSRTFGLPQAADCGGGGDDGRSQVDRCQAAAPLDILAGSRSRLVYAPCCRECLHDSQSRLPTGVRERERERGGEGKLWPLAQSSRDYLDRCSRWWHCTQVVSECTGKNDLPLRRPASVQSLLRPSVGDGVKRGTREVAKKKRSQTGERKEDSLGRERQRNASGRECERRRLASKHSLESKLAASAGAVGSESAGRQGVLSLFAPWLGVTCPSSGQAATSHRFGGSVELPGSTGSRFAPLLLCTGRVIPRRPVRVTDSETWPTAVGRLRSSYSLIIAHFPPLTTDKHPKLQNRECSIVIDTTFTYWKLTKYGIDTS